MERLRTEIIRSKSKKAFYRVLKRWMYGKPLDSVELALNLTSMLTHTLIEMKVRSKDSSKLVLAKEMDIEWQTENIALLIYGIKSSEEIRKVFIEKYGEAYGLTKKI